MTDDQTPAPDHHDADAERAEAFDADAALEAALTEVASLKEQMLRVAAEAENVKRRAERESNDARAYAIQKFARDLLGVADNLERALQHAPRESEDASVKNLTVGLDMTNKALQEAFERNQLKRVSPERGERFDPHLHQAMMEQPSEDVAPGSVLQVLQSGYELFGRLVRPAMVVVSPKAAAPAPAPAETNPYAQNAADPAGGAFDTKA